MRKEDNVSVVIVSHNRPDLLRRSLKSVFTQSKNPDEVVVIDNFSANSHKIRDMINDEFPDIKLIRSEKNLGFTAGMNLGFDNAHGDYILSHEDDLMLESDYIEKLMSVFMVKDDAGAVSGVVLDEHHNILCAGGRCNLNKNYFRVQFPESEKGYIGKPGFRLQDWVPGGTFMVKKNILNILGGFDERFFIYEEDIDFSLRLRNKGYKIYYATDAFVYHLREEPQKCYSSDSVKKIMFHRYKNPIMLYIKHAKFINIVLFTLNYHIFCLKRLIKRLELSEIKAWIAGNVWIIRNSFRLLYERYKNYKYNV